MKNKTLMLLLVALNLLAVSAVFKLEAQQPFTSTPSGLIAYMNAACPTGWTEFTSARGNYIVGLVSGGTLNTAVGSVLTNQENRATGIHGHSVSDPGHIHPIGVSNDGGVTTTIGIGNGSVGAHVNSDSAVTGLTVVNSTGVAGTNAPYIQLRVCQKN